MVVRVMSNRASKAGGTEPAAGKRSAAAGRAVLTSIPVGNHGDNLPSDRRHRSKDRRQLELDLRVFRVLQSMKGLA